ncbi:uncharacterized protein [Palaemon carinicauda]|uniref:uncharacterized protein isoform X2 n=1 Tax=Palaemon carinicauda TaxID=392227 RepID=UPI0035B63D17
MGYGKGDVDKDSIDSANDRNVIADEPEGQIEVEDPINLPLGPPSPEEGNAGAEPVRFTHLQDQENEEHQDVGGFEENQDDPEPEFYNFFSDDPEPEGQIEVEDPINLPLGPPSPQEGNAGAEPVRFAQLLDQENEEHQDVGGFEENQDDPEPEFYNFFSDDPEPEFYNIFSDYYYYHI